MTWSRRSVTTSPGSASKQLFLAYRVADTDDMRAWWVAGAAIIVTCVVAVRTVLSRGRRSHTMMSVSEQWLADHKRHRTR
jgi:hypothetical protein